MAVPVSIEADGVGHWWFVNLIEEGGRVRFIYAMASKVVMVVGLGQDEPHRGMLRISVGMFVGPATKVLIIAGTTQTSAR